MTGAGRRAGMRGVPRAALGAALGAVVLLLVMATAAPSLGMGGAGRRAPDPDPGTPWRLAIARVVEALQPPSLLAPGGEAVAPQAAVEPPWAWPLPGVPPVLKRFDPPPKRWLPGHRGIDLGGSVGSPVRAVDDGVVSYSGSIAGVGIVAVEHAGGLRSTYQPVEGRAHEGDGVARGEVIGTLGDVGGHCLLRTCLHLGAIEGKDHYLDPLLFLGAWELSLLPLSD